MSGIICFGQQFKTLPISAINDHSIFISLLLAHPMTATYQKRGLHFLYPENWRLSDEGGASLPCSISLESPDGNAFWSLHLHESDADPDEILKDLIDHLENTYPDIEVSPFQDDRLGHHSTGVEAMFYCLDFLVRVRLQVFSSQRYQLLFWYQAEDRDFDKLELVFQAMTKSVLDGL